MLIIGKKGMLQKQENYVFVLKNNRKIYQIKYKSKLNMQIYSNSHKR